MYFFLNGEQPTFSTTLTRWPLAISAHSSTHSSIHPHIHSSGALWFLNLHLSGGIEPQPSVVRRPELLQITHTHAHVHTDTERDTRTYKHRYREIHSHTNTDTEIHSHTNTDTERDTHTHTQIIFVLPRI